jgi:hypothetical protein
MSFRGGERALEVRSETPCIRDGLRFRPCPLQLQSSANRCKVLHLDTSRGKR